MGRLRKHYTRIAVTLVPLLLALVHASGLWHWSALDRLDGFLYDVRLRMTLAPTLDPRIVIVDIDEASLQANGQWPWRRDRLAQLVDEIIGRQQAAALGLDVVFAEPDAKTAGGDAAFARAITGRPVALGFYFTRGESPLTAGRLPAPVLPLGAFPAQRDYASNWNGYGAAIAPLSEAAAAAGFINAAIDAADDGLLRAAPLIARYDGAAGAGYYESLGFSLYRLAHGLPDVAPVFAPDPPGGGAPALQALALGEGAAQIRVPVDSRARLLVPFRGPGGARGGSFRYIPAKKILEGALAPGALRGAIVLVGASAPGLQDLWPTPVSGTFPGVEVHANVISALLDRRLLAVPDYALGYDVVVLVVAGLVLAFGLALLSMPRGLVLVFVVTGAVFGLNAWLYAQAGLVLPLAAALVMIGTTFVLSMSWGDFVEARARRRLAGLFGRYVPPELVERMLEQPHRYSMRAESKELTVMFCDIRGFTALAERMPPLELQALLNRIFSVLTEVISRTGGTIDKYMGDCVMAFWGAPVATPAHAALAVQAALEMVQVLQAFNSAQRANGGPEIEVGIGLNTGIVSVGDMGSAVRRSYTVIGDEVNLASRLQTLAPHYGVAIVASAATCAQAPEYRWQPLDHVRVRGKAQAVSILTPIAPAGQVDPAQSAALAQWERVLAAHRAGAHDQAAACLAPLLSQDAENVLYQIYAQRIASLRTTPPAPEGNGAGRPDIRQPSSPGL